MFTIIIAIILPFLAAALIPFFYKRLSLAHIHIGWFVLVIPVVLFIILSRYIPLIAKGETYLKTVQWIPTYGINFSAYLDGLSLIFGLLITGVGSLVILYSIFYLSARESLHHFYIYLLLFMGAMLGVVFSDNLLVLYAFWELTSISSFLLIAFWYQRRNSRYGAQKSLLITVSGGIAMLAGFIMLYLMTDTLSIREIAFSIGNYTESSSFIPAMLLILLGAFTKSAQFPFHIWLPDAMEAPTPVSAYLHSATMVKAGIYLVARFTPVFGGDQVWFWVVSLVGIFTLFWGSFSAVRQVDLKALLAYSTISQLGLIMSLFGLGSVALHSGVGADSIIYTQASFAALFHLINHSTFKGALFMVVGIIDHELGTRDVRKLGGLMSFMPVTFTIAIIGSFSMAGLPPFNGFLSKEMFFEAVVKITQLNVFSLDTWGLFFPIVAWIASVFTFVYCMIIVFRTFLGKYQPDLLEFDAKEAPVGMLISPIILALFVVGIFFFPNLLSSFIIKPAMASIFPVHFELDRLVPHIKAWHGPNMPLFMTIGVVLVGVFLYRFLRHWTPVYNLLPPDWSLNTVYNLALIQAEKRSAAITKSYMTGILKDYASYIYIFFTIAVGGALLLTGAFSLDISDNAPIRIYEIILVIVMMVAAIFILFAQSRLTAILLNGVLGFSISIFFVLFRAPDLALTQLIVETVTTALFLLCFTFLPAWKKESYKPKTKTLHALIAVATGTIVTLIALSVQSNKMFETISVYFERAYELAGGKNIVNTILGDFRAFDTMLEIVVLFIAGLGVYALIKLRPTKEAQNNENK